MVPKELKKYIIACIIVWVIDIFWITLVMSRLYGTLGELLKNEIIIYSAFAAWLLIPLGLVVFVDKVSSNYRQSLIYGVIYGLILYGVYEFTNHAVLVNWTLKLVAIDTIWGVFLCSVSALLLKYSGKFIN